MPPIVLFERVSKSYRLRPDRPRSFRELFVNRWHRRGTALAPTTRLLWALRDVTFDIQPGETIGLIGPNGAGKSTALKLISRIIAPASGRVETNGRVAALLELGTGFHPDLTGRHNIFLSGALSGMSRQEMKRKFDSIVAFSELEPFIDLPVKRYSSGMFARLAFAVSIHLDPEVLLVDEVLAVGDQAFQIKCLDRIGELKRQGMTICLVTHSPDLVRSMCTRAIWFDRGRLMAEGMAESVLAQYLNHSASMLSDHLSGEGQLDSTQRWGSRRIEIVRVRLTDDHGRAQTVFETGQPFVLHLDYLAHSAVPRPIFGMAIHRQDGAHVCGPNTEFGGLVLPIVQGSGSVSYSVPYLPLLEGLYQISVAVHDRDDREFFDYHDRAYTFRVINTHTRVRERYGILTLRGEWAHTTTPSP